MKSWDVAKEHLERSENRVLAGEGNPGGTGEGPEGVYPPQGVPEGVPAGVLVAATTATGEWMGSVDGGAPGQQQLQDLELIAVRGQDHRRDVSGIIRALLGQAASPAAG